MSDPTAESIIARAFEVGAGVSRPAHFTNHTHCCECLDHDNELQPHTPETIPRSALGTMAWDPITFCTDEAFRYYLPGLIRIVLTESGEDNYYEQFLWHLTYVGEGRDWHHICTQEERKVVAAALNWLLENRSEEVEAECASEDLLAAIERWDTKSSEYKFE